VVMVVVEVAVVVVWEIEVMVFGVDITYKAALFAPFDNFSQL
jgi:hypothetical protein